VVPLYSLAQIITMMATSACAFPSPPWRVQSPLRPRPPRWGLFFAGTVQKETGQDRQCNPAIKIAPQLTSFTARAAGSPYPLPALTRPSLGGRGFFCNDGVHAAGKLPARGLIAGNAYI
jgi:hypothetical protein